MGLPWDTHESLAALIAFACELDPDVVEFFYPYPFPGTTLQRQCVELGLLAPGEIPKQSYAYPALRDDDARAKTSSRPIGRRRLRAFYVRPRKIVRTLLGLDRRASSPITYASGGLQLRQPRDPAQHVAEKGRSTSLAQLAPSEAATAEPARNHASCARPNEVIEREGLASAVSVDDAADDRLPERQAGESRAGSRGRPPGSRS